MQLFFHDVGLKGSDKDFPKTIFSDIAIDDILKYIPQSFKDEIGASLISEFPEGFCNAWGVPAGAKSVIKNLNVDDIMLLIRTTSGSGDMPALCRVKGFWREHMPELSNFLWDSDHYPYVFFFRTQHIELSWTQFKEDIGYKPNFRPSGNVYRVSKAEDKLSRFDGIEGYVAHLTKKEVFTVYEHRTEYKVDDITDQEYEEGERKIKEISYFKRNPKLVEEAKKHYGYNCQVCGFNFEKNYGDIGKNYIECHHKNPLSERDDNFHSTIQDVCMLCSNCHRMIHGSIPALSLDELKDNLK